MPRTNLQHIFACSLFVCVCELRAVTGWCVRWKTPTTIWIIDISTCNYLTGINLFLLLLLLRTERNTFFVVAVVADRSEWEDKCVRIWCMSQWTFAKIVYSVLAKWNHPKWVFNSLNQLEICIPFERSRKNRFAIRKSHNFLNKKNKNHLPVQRRYQQITRALALSTKLALIVKE